MVGLKKLLHVFLLFILSFSSVYPKVIITHGVLGKDSDWYRSGGHFFEAVSKEAQEIGQSVSSFSWEQDLAGVTHLERIKAGMQLAKIILDLKRNGEKEIILIGHSYGGHVVKVASQLLGYLNNKPDKLEQEILDQNNIIEDGVAPEVGENVLAEDGKPLVDIEDQDILDDIKEFINDLNDLDDAVLNDVDILQEDEFFQEACEQILEYEKEKLDGKAKDEIFLIDAVYTLGTPNDIPDYQADMNVIKYLYNFSSKGDLVQDFVGDHLLPEPKHERAVNICVEIKGSGWLGIFGRPNHTQMHAKIIGKWILDIPFILMESGVGNFDKFSFEYDGIVKFESNNSPSYKASLDGVKEDGIFAQYDLSWLFNKINILGNIC